MIVGILGPGGCGGTFLDWSIHYLRGDSRYYHIECDNLDRSQIKSQQFLEICSDPLSSATAHNHEKTHPNNGSLQQVIKIFNKLPCSDLHTFYYVDSMTSDQTQTTHNDIIRDNKNLCFLTYSFDLSDVDKIFCFQYEKIGSVASRFEKSIGKQFSSLPIWDQRELLSLYYPTCIRGQTVNEIIEPCTNNFLINFSKMLNSLDQIMPDIFDFLQIRMDKSRWKLWLDTYQTWRQKNKLEFFENLNYIVSCILNNVDHDMTCYNMTFAKEVIVASKLLYDHNKALKSYNLENIHTNSQSWYEILEENVYHNLLENEKDNL